MKEKQIIKALELCKQQTVCTGCPYISTKMGCQVGLIGDALNLINLKNEEIKKYAQEQHYLMIEKDQLFDIAEKQKKEIEMLMPFGTQVEVSKKIEQKIKVEATEDFVKRFERKIKDVQFTLGQTWELQNALKETLKETEVNNG